MKRPEMSLPSIDDLFTNQEQRDEMSLEKIVNIPIKDIVDFPKHPFKVNIEEDLLSSIKDKGVLVPAIVRKKADGTYEMVSGHRRKKASEMLKLETIPCIVRDLSDDEATIIMVDSNFQREKILPSEKAFAYKMKLEAMSHQGKATSRQVVDKLKSVDIIGQTTNESGRNVQRYIRLTELIPKLLEMVDNDTLGLTPKMALSPAVEISYLTKEEQNILLDSMECNDCTPSHAQAIRLKDLSKNQKLTPKLIEEIMEEEKPNQDIKLRISLNKISNVLPKNLTSDKEREDYIVKAVIHYDKFLQKKREKKQVER